MTLVVDASAVTAALIDPGDVGSWARSQLLEGALLAPQHLHVEVANALRRGQLSGGLTRDVATLAHEDLLSLPIDLMPYPPMAHRAWELRASVSSYDAAYVALAERFDADLVTLDRRLMQAPGPCCRFRALPTAPP